MGSAKSQIDIRKVLGISGGAVAADVILDDGKTVEQELKAYARALMTILDKHILKAYKPGKNRRYHRTYGALDAAIDYTMSSSLEDGGIVVQCHMTDSGRHCSYFSPGTVNTLILMDKGYQVKNPAMAKIPWFGHRPAGNIIKETLDEFDARINKLGVVAEIKFD